MANTFNLGGSPLGLIGVLSRPSRDGMSTFNGGKSRNVNVSKYNNGSKQGESGKERRVSLFSGGSIPSFWANIGVAGTDQDETGTKNKDSYKGINRNTLHNNDVYDTSILNIIEKLSSSNRAALRPQDFAYLKFLGVYPNNRLMIARRFSTPMKDNIMTKGGSAPLSTLISWKPETDENFLDFTFGEEWTEANADFTDVLNKLGENFGIGGGGSGGGKGLNVLPLPGFTETLQRKLLVELGVLEASATDESKPLPSGNPNIIKMAKRRKTIGYGESGSGLKCDISIKMVCEYEQKFISGIDPTIAWMDIMNNILSFGTSNSDNYGLSTTFKANIERWTDGQSGIQKLLDDIIGAITGIFEGFKKDVEDLVKKLIPDAKPSEPAEPAKEKTQKQKQADIEKQRTATLDPLKKTLNNAIAAINKTIEKYRIELMGIANALSGAPSTPWHITIGNPLRPVFCSGDMYISDTISLKLGSTLAFNDLPSTIKAEFTLKNARPLGMQEIMAKFNTGYLRTVNTRKDFAVTNNLNEYYDNDGAKVQQESSGSSTGSVNNQQQAATPIVNKENAQQNSQNRTV
jgi:hypothetical protein